MHELVREGERKGSVCLQQVRVSPQVEGLGFRFRVSGFGCEQVKVSAKGDVNVCARQGSYFL